ncbi:hypothetical protein EV421DRAFT_1043618 [Armillaria borealis]|uniref:Uncharacterized protein n=1 Tax=Armillaria borealis TaxID=47425 RepID=A0AA39JZK6_9AGAR|nr:hypothetical protein EV421DRAFT_1043618 [Armillaria borealis]
MSSSVLFREYHGKQSMYWAHAFPMTTASEGTLVLRRILKKSLNAKRRLMLFTAYLTFICTTYYGPTISRGYTFPIPYLSDFGLVRQPETSILQSPCIFRGLTRPWATHNSSCMPGYSV